MDPNYEAGRYAAKVFMALGAAAIVFWVSWKLHKKIKEEGKNERRKH